LSGFYSKTWGDDASGETVGFNGVGKFDYVVGTGLLLADATHMGIRDDLCQLQFIV